jgi:predicted TIM-barrel fold metal-dependent hydrolase
MPDRRWFVAATSRFVIGCMAGPISKAAAQESLRIPWSSGTEAPHSKAPENAADCHHHIYDSRFPADPTAKLHPGNATVADYRLLQRRIGTTRNVIVQPSTYGVDNRCMLDALRQFGPRATRGIAVVNADVPDSALRELNAAGVRGIRFNLLQAGATTPEMIEPLSKRIASLGWHIQINASPEQIVAAMPLWNRIPVPVVFDHLGHVSTPAEPVFVAICKLLEKRKGWVKLSGVYLDSKAGPPGYRDRAAVTKAYIKQVPDRLVWGTDWPHPTAAEKPDDALLFDLLAEWCPDAGVRSRILVDNPAKLYGF